MITKTFYTPKDNDFEDVFDTLKLAMLELLDDIFGAEHLKNFELFYKHDKTRFSKQNILCVKCDDKIAGVMCSYGGKDALGLDIYMNEVLKKYQKTLECECGFDEYYLDSIAVDENFRGLGVFKMLVNECFVLAKEKEYDKVSLLAKNPELYKGFGFEIKEEFLLYSEKYYKMIKLL